MDTAVDYYSILGIKPSASVEDIKRAYRQMVFRYHPDRNPENSEAAAKFNQVRDAYSVLSDVLKRRVYDSVNYPAGNEEEAKEEPAQEKTEEKAEQSTHRNGHESSGAFNFKQEFKQKVEPEPKCPSCAVVGIDHIVSRKGGSGSARGKHFVLSPFNVVLCNACGHVYGVTGNSN